MNVLDSEIKSLMSNCKKFVVYGLSPDPEKPSHYVPLYMKENGWDVVGVYPKSQQASHYLQLNWMMRDYFWRRRFWSNK